MTRRMLDLFSGLGGASEAFVEAGWDVIRIEKEPLCADIPHTHINDVELIPHVINYGASHFTKDRFDLVWASPPCREFSTGYSGPMATAKREGRPYSPNMDLLKVSLEVIRLLDPKWYVIENVQGSMEFFKPYLGAPRQKIGMMYLYGKFPLIHANVALGHKANQDTWSDDPLRVQKKAKVPLEISEALLRSIEGQSTLEDFV
jgi:hypothetical protein